MKLRSFANQIYLKFAATLRVLFDYEVEKQHPIISVIWLALIYLIGLYFWGVFFDWGHTPLNYADWKIINLPRLDVIRDALVYGQLPLHVTKTGFLHELTDRFFTLPDVITTPQQILLFWIDIDTFAIFDLLMQFTIGTIGLYLFKQKYKISLLAFSVMFFLFNFNGYIQSHYSVGHITWGGYFLFPLLILLITDFTDGQQNWAWVAKIAFLLFYMVLLGSQHHFVWSLLFLGTLGLVAWKKLWWIISAGFFAGMLSAIRLLPPILEIANIKSTRDFEFRTGFPHIQDILSSMFFLYPNDYHFPGLPEPLIETTRYWEFDVYVGLAGGVIILYFGIFKWVADLRSEKRFWVLLAPTLVVLLLSIGQNYSLLGLPNIPLFATERVTSRMFGLPLTVVIMLSAFFLSEWLRGKYPLPRYVLTVLGLLWVTKDLFAHIALWGIKITGPALVKGYGRILIKGNSISNHADFPYMVVLMIGLVLTITFAILLLVLMYREKSLHQQTTGFSGR